MTEPQLRNELCRVGRSLFERGYVHATAGNISVRLTDGFLITPTDACLGFLEPGRLARVNGNGVQTGGDRASKTLELHRRIYNSDDSAMQMQAAGTPIRAVMLDRLGPNVWHNSPAAAMAVLEELEETARLWLMTQPKPQPLSENAIQQLRENFGAIW